MTFENFHYWVVSGTAWMLIIGTGLLLLAFFVGTAFNMFYLCYHLLFGLPKDLREDYDSDQ